MGRLINGQWHDQWYNTAENQGQFKRSEAQFRNWVTPDGSAGPSGVNGFKAQAGRYHLYISHACPWANRTMIFRQLKGLNELIDVSVVNWFMAEHGWTFAPGTDVTGDKLYGLDYLYQLYLKADPNYSGRVTVPVLWDSERQTIVSNESADIIRMFNSAFDEVGAKAGDYYPQALRGEIDKLNNQIYDTVNNGVYKAGFATTQQAYEDSVYPLFKTLDQLEARLATHRYLLGDTLTEADWRLFTTLVRFDAVYYGHFKCNIRRISDYPNLFGYLRELYQMDGIAQTIHFDHIKGHYYQSHDMINPTQIVPVGPEIDLNAPHQRQHIS
ncbi:glutathione S-transferase family protein [Celerinatantimonas diazotrophica]|uniref:Putative glutathione S-transferase n=1 Tax=Celerinatantimonas diazotrophica TaxID=412034 RepID=A0A4R1K385_9GAMM|nr:glutathione S-transferase family protein [Celerinatantimonas diazotrophica]TCK58556.1 putative glutathione S-transferase [Celerinatantimonas diazotrophica]CAG9297185.1 Glutathionyl-hydroquinone reductase YqjG [Celerinatantimonas diazotrophica]